MYLENYGYWFELTYYNDMLEVVSREAYNPNELDPDKHIDFTRDFDILFKCNEARLADFTNMIVALLQIATNPISSKTLATPNIQREILREASARDSNKALANWIKSCCNSVNGNTPAS